MKYIINLIILPFLFSPAFGQQNSLLWKIESASLAKPSYLYGTMHSRDKRAHMFGDSVIAKLEQCDAVALEMLTNDLMANPFAMIGAIMMEDTTLDMLLKEDDYQKVKSYATAHLEMFGMVVDKILPIFTSSLIMELSFNNDMDYTVDEFFEKKAMEDGKKTIGIETFEEQMNALKQISLKDQAQMLVEQMNSMEKDSIMFEQLMNYYQSQNLTGMYGIYTKEDMPEMFDKALVVKRNHVMSERIDSIIQQQPTFIAVGALHLAGEEGLIELISHEGYKVSPVISRHSSITK